MTTRRLATVSLVLLLAGCATPVASVETAQDIADRIVDAVGEPPDERDVLARTNNQVNTLADTVHMTWVGIDLGDDPVERLEQVVHDAGLELTRGTIGLPSSDPRSGPDGPELLACDPRARPRAGATVSFGPADDGRGHVVIIETGGPPAASGCRD